MLDWSIILPAFAAGICVLLSHVPLGREVLHRGIIFIDLAIAQFAGLGIIIAYTLGFETHESWAIQSIAFSSAIAGALLLHVTEKYFTRTGFAHAQEAFIGICFVLAASASVLLLSGNVHGGEQLKDLLVGQILWTEWTQLNGPAVIGAFIFVLSIVKPQLLKSWVFYIVFALAITVSVQLVGVYLVFSSLIIPALGISLLNLNNYKKELLAALCLGAAAYFGGLLCSSLIDLPAGAVIVWGLALCALLCHLVFSIIKR